MIKINLLPKKKKVGLPVIMGVNLNQLNFKMLVVAFLITFLPDLINSRWEEELSAITNESKVLDKKLKNLKKEAKAQGGIQKAIDIYILQEKKLKERLGIVKNIIKLKQNPSEIMLYVAKIVPTDLWILNLKFEGNKLSITGRSISYKSIGIFIEGLKNSVYFDKSIRLVTSKTKKDEKSGKRTEEFEIVGIVSRFN